MAAMNTDQKQCCMCGNTILPNATDPLTLTVTDGDETQELWCHARCLRRAVHESVPLLFDDG